VGPVLDLRVPGASWIDYGADRDRAEHLLALGSDVPASTLLHEVFSRRAGWSTAQIEQRTAQFLGATRRWRGELDGWLNPCRQAGGAVLDLGCGGGQFLAALAPSGRECVGLDVSVEWLVVAHRVLSEAGTACQLIAALAEALPFGDGAFAAVVSLDVLEHVGDRAGYLREIDRILQPLGVLFLTTPNRFSAAAEPHVGIWGVGWVPRRWQKTYVARRTSVPYEFVRLTSYMEIKRLFRRHTRVGVQVTVPPIPMEDLARMSRRRVLLARVYNALVGFPPAALGFRAVGPYFRVMGQKA